MSQRRGVTSLIGCVKVPDRRPSPHFLGEAMASGAIASSTPTGQPVLSVQDLSVSFTPDTLVVQNISFSVQAGETVAVVGESGSGKTTMVNAILGLIPRTGLVKGSILLEGNEIVGAQEKEIRRLRGLSMAYVPQDPMSNLNPVTRVGRQVIEAARAHKRLPYGDARDLAVQAMERAGLSNAKESFRRFPHQLSGGMRQRSLIAMGIINSPRLLIADEPTSALDVTVQQVILDNLADLVRKTGTSVLFITHDLGLAAERADRVLVMRNGRLVESGPSKEVLLQPKAGYTRQLVAAAPLVSSKTSGRLAVAVPEAPVLLALDNVTKSYALRKEGERRKAVFKALAGVSLELRRGQTLAIVGESGSGKSTAANLALRLTLPSSGRVLFDGKDLAGRREKELSDFRRRVQPIFQDPYASLDPMFTVEKILEEPLSAFRLGDRSNRRLRIRELLDQVALPTTLLSRSPKELSGGQRQRVAIARALASEPDVIICDEPVSALDVLVQAQILDVLLELQRELNLTYMFISHDLGVVKEVAHEVVVMKRGRIVEKGKSMEIFERPREEYTRALLDAVPGRSLYEQIPAALV